LQKKAFKRNYKHPETHAQSKRRDQESRRPRGMLGHRLRLRLREYQSNRAA
jgi:hypothetical protein